MSNYTTENLVPATPTPGVPAIRIGDQVFQLSGGSGGSSSTFELVKVIAYTPESPSHTDTTAIALSGMTSGENDYSVLNGTYNVTPETANVTLPLKRIYKHSTSEYYLYHYTEYGEGYWCIGSTAGAGPWGSMLTLYSNSALTDGTETWNNMDWGESQNVTVAITNTTTPAVSFSLTAQKITGYTESGDIRTYTASGTNMSLTAADETPVVNKIAVVSGTRLIIMTNCGMQQSKTGLVFHAPLSASSATAETGQTMTETGTVTYQTVNGIPCAYFGGSARLTVTDMSGLPVNGADNTIAGWFRYDYVSNFNHLFGYGDEYGIRAYSYYEQIVYNKNGSTGVDLQSVSIEQDTWYHVAATWDGTVCNMYLNGSLVAQGSDPQTFDGSRPLTIGAMDRSGNGYGYVADVRVYNRALSTAEIAAIAAELTPIS